MQSLKTAVSVFLGLAVVLILIFGPRPDSEHPAHRVVVSYWEKWTGKEASQMQEIVRDFNNGPGARDGIYVEFLSMSSINQKTLVATAAGVPPDVAGLWDGQVPQFAAIDALEPLDQLAAGHGITEATYKPVYWKGCHYDGKLWALVSTPAAVALMYNKVIFQQNAAKLRAAGLDPNRAPRTLDELDRYASALDSVDSSGNMLRAGYLPMEPGWYITQLPYWFGGDVFDAKTQKFTLTSPPVEKAFEWVRGYSLRLGKNAVSDFHSGLGGYDSPQNPFMVGKLAMEQQGPWLANTIETNRPQLNRVLTSDKAEEMTWPIEKRRENYAWGAAPFPSAVPGMEDVAYCPFDVMVIPRGAKHPKAAFEFMAYVNSQPVMEKLCMMHCKNSPLREVSQNFLQHHPNPYIAVFEQLASSPNAKGLPPLGILPEVTDELTDVAQRVTLLEATPQVALAEAQDRLQAKYDRFRAMQTARKEGSS